MRGSLVVAAFMLTALRSCVQAAPSPLFFSAPVSPLLDPYPKLPLLHFSKGRFKLAVFTDTHMIDNQDSPGNATAVNAATTAELAHYLDVIKPDFVVHSGDVISGEAANSTADVENAVKQIFSPLVKARVPFAVTHGNHDNDKFSTHARMGELERATAPSLCYTRRAAAEASDGEVGVDNYYVPVYNGKFSRRGSRPALLLWFFDSRSGKTTLPQGNKQIEDWVQPSVATWLNKTSAELTRAWGTLPPSLVFVHIPTRGHWLVQNASPKQNLIGGVYDERPDHYNATEPLLPYPGLNEDKPLQAQGQAVGQDAYAGQDQPFLTALAKGPTGRSRIHGIVSGHDHGNDWAAPSSLITAKGPVVPVIMAKKDGSGGYDYDEWNHGSRVFEFELNKVEDSVTTWLQLQTGETRFKQVIDDAWARKGAVSTK